jgi:hypothetical protein
MRASCCAQRRGQAAEQLAERMDAPGRRPDAQAGQGFDRCAGRMGGRNQGRPLRRCRRRFAAEQPAEPIDQCLGKLLAKAATARLGQDIARAQRQCLDRRRTALLAAAREDRHLALRVRSQDRGQRRQAALPRQFDVEQHQVDAMFGQIAQRIFRAVGLVDDGKAGIGVQDALDHRAHHHRIVNHQRAHRGSGVAVEADHGRHEDGH